MFYYLSQMPQWLVDNGHAAWADWLSFLRVFQYITFRTAGAAVTALLLSWWLGPKIIAKLKQLKFSQQYEDKAEAAGGLKARVNKKGTPSMGGVMIVLTLDITALLWARWNEFLALTLMSVVVLAALGFYDDWVKLTKQDKAGIHSKVKLIVQIGLGLFIALYLWNHQSMSDLVRKLMMPFYPEAVDFAGAGIVGLLITVAAIVGSSNAVNLTDGLDGLAIGCTLIVAFVFIILTYIAGNVKTAEYLLVPYVEGAGELTVFCAAMIGAGLGFLWFNCHPAQVFMGDTGSLALGGSLGVIAVLIHQPFVLVIAGGVFVLEALSVMIQTGWFKYTRRKYGEGRRVFLMAPLHHHFEKKGWHESQVVARFYILGILFAVLALSTLKLR
ncbi:MAG: phospho-N-acetylmuramoyl-pentapeptide-transferase [Limisphaerales bacterium]|tara:strand:- start:10043 stop:11197 length:1155 start_codon:yes stop_codon:yes gene_type:complete